MLASDNFSTFTMLVWSLFVAFVLLPSFHGQQSTRAAAQIQTIGSSQPIFLPIISPKQVDDYVNAHSATTNMRQMQKSRQAGQFPGRFPIHANFLGLSAHALLERFRILDGKIGSTPLQSRHKSNQNVSPLYACFKDCKLSSLRPVALLTSSFKRSTQGMHNLDRLTTNLMFELQNIGHCSRIIAIEQSSSSEASIALLRVNNANSNRQLTICEISLPVSPDKRKVALNTFTKSLSNISVIVNDVSLQETSRAVVLMAAPRAIWSIFNNQQQAYVFKNSEKYPTYLQRVIHTEQLQARHALSGYYESPTGQSTSVLRSQVAVVPNCLELLVDSKLTATATQVDEQRRAFIAGNNRIVDSSFVFALPHNEGKLQYSLSPALVAIALAALFHEQKHTSPVFHVWMHHGYAFRFWVNHLVKTARDLLRGSCVTCSEYDCCAALGNLAALYSMDKHQCCKVRNLLRRISLEQALLRFAAAFRRIAHLPHTEYFLSLQRASLYLDSHPVGGGTTSMDALFVGVPVVTKPSSIDAGRLALSHYLSMGLSGKQRRFGSLQQGSSNTNTPLESMNYHQLHLVAASWPEYVAHALWHFGHPAASQRTGRMLAVRSEVLFNDTRAAVEWSRLIQSGD